MPRRTLGQGAPPAQEPRQRLTRQFQLNAADRANLTRQELISNYIDLLLDLSQKHTYEEMGELLGRSPRYLTDILNNDEEFQREYDKRLEAMRSGGRVGAARLKIEELAINAALTLESIMEDTSISAKTRAEAAVAILDRAGINGKDIPKRGNHDNLREFLEQMTGGQVNLTQINLQQIITTATPQAYTDQLQQIMSEIPQIAPAAADTPEIGEYNEDIIITSQTGTQSSDD